MAAKREIYFAGNSLYPRPRINNLLSTAIGYSIVTVIAGPGYGKTEAVSAFASRLRQRVAWVNLSNADNNPSHFWVNLTDSLMREMPFLGKTLMEYGFPGSLEDYNQFIKALAKSVYDGEEFILVVDNFHEINNRKILDFFTKILKNDMENLCIILISSERQNYLINLFSYNSSFFSINYEDLQFTEEETIYFLRHNNLSLTEDEAKQIHNETGGWPFALSHYVKMQKIPGREKRNHHLELAANFFELNFYSSYTQEMQKLLIKLSFFPYFTVGLIRELCTGDTEKAVETISFNTFIVFDMAANLFYIQPMYKTFLERKKDFLPREELKETAAKAGKWFLENSFVYEAMTQFHICKDYSGLTKAVLAMPKERSSVGTSNHILKYLNDIPHSFRKNNIETDLCRAYMYLNDMKVNIAKNILLEIIANVDSENASDIEKHFLGESYALLGDICMLQQTDDFAAHFEKAYSYLTKGSEIRPLCSDYVDNNSAFFLTGNEKGNLERSCELMCKAARYNELISGSFGCGIELLFAAEAAFNTYDFIKARSLAYEAILKSNKQEQYDIVCNSYWILLRTAMFYGDYKEAKSLLDEVKLIADGRNYCGLETIKESIESYFYMRLGDINKVSPWIISYDSSQKDEYPVAAGRNILLAAYGRFENKNYTEALAILASLDSVYAEKGIWSIKLTALLIKASSLLALNFKDEAIKQFWLAYSMSYENNIITPFVELGNICRSLVSLAKNSPEYNFDDSWLENILNKSSSYAKRIATLLSDYKKDSPSRQNRTNSLTKRENEVLIFLSQGLTREEIADLMGISVNGIKKHITSIYNKLGAINRADAIRIATGFGYLA